jgi:hypothetical protein
VDACTAHGGVGVSLAHRAAPRRVARLAVDAVELSVHDTGSNVTTSDCDNNARTAQARPHRCRSLADDTQHGHSQCTGRT